jgi:hypothetical protein
MSNGFCFETLSREAVALWDCTGMTSHYALQRYVLYVCCRTDGHTSVSGTLHYLHHSSSRTVNYIACWCDRLKLYSLIRNNTASYFTRLVIPIASVLTLSALIYLHLAARIWRSSMRDVDGREHLRNGPEWYDWAWLVLNGRRTEH